MIIHDKASTEIYGNTKKEYLIQLWVSKDFPEVKSKLRLEK